MMKYSCNSIEEGVKTTDAGSLFFDIETTSLSPKTGQIYLIGAARFDVQTKQMNIMQWLIESKEEEKELLASFLQVLSDGIKTILHFNGTTFDLPYLKARMEQHGLTQPDWDTFSYRDFYREYAPYQKLFSLPDKKQKTWERFLDTDRKDLFTGGELIDTFQHYSSMPANEDRSELEHNLLLHNFEDVRGLLLLPHLDAYLHIFDGTLSFVSEQHHTYDDFDGSKQSEWLLEARLPAAALRELRYQNTYYALRVSGCTVRVRIPVKEMTLKYFFPNYKEYYYLPDEDRAIHKSLGMFVEKTHRIQATAQTGYQKQKGRFFLQPAPLFSPAFYEQTPGKNAAVYALCKEGIWNDRSLSEFLSFGYRFSANIK